MRKLWVGTVCLALVMLAGCGKATHDSVTAEAIKLMNDMADILASIKDEASAKSAKPKLEALSKRMDALKQKSQALGVPTKEQKDALQKKYGEERTKAASRLLKDIFRIALDPKLNAQLKDTLSNMKKSD